MTEFRLGASKSLCHVIGSGAAVVILRAHQMIGLWLRVGVVISDWLQLEYKY